MALSYTYSVTLAELLAVVRQYGEWRSNQISDQQATRAINDGVVDAHNIIRTHGPDRLLASSTSDVVSGTEAYAMPVDCGSLRVVGLLNSDASRSYRRLAKINLAETYAVDSAAVSRDSVVYTVEGRSVILYPTPTWSDTDGIKFVYERAAPQFDYSATSDTFDFWGVGGARQYALAFAVWLLAGQTDDPQSPWSNWLKESKAALVRNARVDKASPKVVVTGSSHTGRRRRAWDYL